MYLKEVYMNHLVTCLFLNKYLLNLSYYSLFIQDYRIRYGSIGIVYVANAKYPWPMPDGMWVLFGRTEQLIPEVVPLLLLLILSPPPFVSSLSFDLSLGCFRRQCSGKVSRDSLWWSLATLVGELSSLRLLPPSCCGSLLLSIRLLPAIEGTVRELPLLLGLVKPQVAISQDWAGG